MKQAWTVPSIAGALIGGLVSCGGGGSGTTAPPVVPPAVRTTGFDVPTEVSPVSTGASASQTGATGFRGALAALSASLPAAYGDAGTDYSNARTLRFVSEHSIDQFAIIETILNAISQTHYAAAENINAGPYKSIVSWQENKQGSQAKTMQTWVVDSTIVQEDGADVNQVKVWIEDSGQLIKAMFKIYASAAQGADGSYLDYGVWTLNVKFDEAGTKYFAARASIGDDGATVLAINEHNSSGNGGTEDRQAIMHKSDTSGYGKVSFPDWVGNSQVQIAASYVYNPAQLAVHPLQPAGQVNYKDRAASVEITSRYGLFDAATGADVLASHSFGFPVAFTLAGVPQYGYYGANQGRHQLWTSQGTPIPDGTTVTRQDQAANAAAYQTASFTGTLTRRTLVAGALGDLQNIPVETWVNFQHQITWNGSEWQEAGAPFTDFATLVNQPRKSVWINGWRPGQGQMGGQPIGNLMYDPSGPGFYPANMGNDGMATRASNTPYAPAAGDQLWINIGGSIYIEYTDAGWVQKTVTAFDQQTWTPTFDPAGDAPYTLELNREYYINNQGGNFVVKYDGSTYDVKMELQAAANPSNATTLLGTATLFKPQGFVQGQSSTFRFGTNPAQAATYLKLVYQTVGTQDQQASPAPQPGAVVAQSQYSLTAWDAQGAPLPTQYNWDYPRNGETQGVQTFLYSDAGQGRVYKLLDDPIQLTPFTLQGHTLSLQFDGWMHGLPDYFNEMARNNYTITDAVAAKIINVPDGTVVTDLHDQAQSYVIKPLEIGLYLKPAAVHDASLDIGPADALVLSAVVPAFVDNLMGAEPALTAVKYSEGAPVQ